MTDANLSPASEAPILPVTDPWQSLSEAVIDTELLPPPPTAQPSERRRLSFAWPLGIALATVALVYASTRSRPRVRPRAAARSGPRPAVVRRAAPTPAPRESERERGEARWRAQALASPGDWLFSALDHHRDIVGDFGAAAAALPGAARAAALRRLATLLMGHSIAEEAVLYPALAQAGETLGATVAYGEQAQTKTAMATLQDVDPESDAFAPQLEEIRAAVLHHIYQEEATWFPLLKQRLGEADQALLTQRFLQEFRRYMHAQG